QLLMDPIRGNVILAKEVPVPRRANHELPLLANAVGDELEGVAPPIGNVDPAGTRRRQPDRLARRYPQPALTLRMRSLLLPLLSLRHMATRVQKLTGNPQHLPIRRQRQRVVADVAPPVPVADLAQILQALARAVVQLRAVMND